MKRNNIKILTVLLAVLLLLVGCADPNPQVEETTSPPINENGIGYYKTVEYKYETSVDPAVLTTNLDPTYLLLANKANVLGSDYVPANLTTLTCDTLQLNRVYELDSRAAQALYAMLAEMKALGVDDVMVASAYRDYTYQKNTYQKYIEYEQSCISADAYRVFGTAYIQENYLAKKIFRLTLEDAETVVQSYSALPGQSEHQTGLCVDFASGENSTKEHLTEAFENTIAFTWLSQNAYKFGFILRYPKGKEDITGYTYEPWHYRFVGREAATDIYFEKSTLEEYLNGLSNAQ